MPFRQRIIFLVLILVILYAGRVDYGHLCFVQRTPSGKKRKTAGSCINDKYCETIGQDGKHSATNDRLQNELLQKVDG